MEAIYKMEIDFGRMGTLEGVFIEDKDDVANLIKSGENVYFGEVLGKHSEVFCPITDKDVKMVTDDKDFIKLFKEFNLTSGYNPFDYIDPEE